MSWWWHVGEGYRKALPSVLFFRHLEATPQYLSKGFELTILELMGQWGQVVLAMKMSSVTVCGQVSNEMSALRARCTVPQLLQPRASPLLPAQSSLLLSPGSHLFSWVPHGQGSRVTSTKVGLGSLTCLNCSPLWKRFFRPDLLPPIVYLMVHPLPCLFPLR